MSNQKNIIKENEIDLIELVKTIWTAKREIIRITFIFGVFGLIIAFTSKVEYKAACKLLPESQESSKPNFGGLSGLAGLAGINLDISTGGTLSPELYPEIINSLPNQLIIINDTLDFESQKLRISSWDYFQNHDHPSLFTSIARYTIGLPFTIKSWFVSSEKTTGNQASDIYRFSKEEWNLITAFKERISINIDSKSGLINISVEMPDAIAAAQLTERVVNLMTEKVIDYKIKKVKNNLKFIREAHNDAEQEYQSIQKRLAIASDQNKHINSASANIELQTLQNEYNLAFEVFKGLASQLEQAKIKLKEETPVFTILEPVRVPETKSKPSKGMIFFVSIILGVFISCSIILFKKFI